MTNLMDIEGIGPSYAQKLMAAGIKSIEKLLTKGAGAKGRKEIADKSVISQEQILEWVNHSDLFRIKGVGSQYADLLESTGVDTVPELANRKAENLHQKNVGNKSAKGFGPQSAKRLAGSDVDLPSKTTSTYHNLLTYHFNLFYI